MSMQLDGNADTSRAKAMHAPVSLIRLTCASVSARLGLVVAAKDDAQESLLNRLYMTCDGNSLQIECNTSVRAFV